MTADHLWILVTGSRLHTRASIPLVRFALLNEVGRRGMKPEQATVVHGAQGVRVGGRVIKGFDLLSAEVAADLGMAVDPHPADWPSCDPRCHPGHRKINREGREYCPTAGFRRNQHMVDLVAAQPLRVALAFPIRSSPGTRDCMTRAEEAGIGMHDLEI